MHLKKLIAAAFAALMLPTAALAQHRGHAHGGGPPPVAHVGHFAPGPVGRFGAHALAAWRGGHWWHGWRGGRVGWWWFADGFWYWYPTPLYPYPDYVPGYWVGGYPAPGAVWWFCDNPPGYYPYVQGCWRWRPVTPNVAPNYPPP